IYFNVLLRVPLQTDLYKRDIAFPAQMRNPITPQRTKTPAAVQRLQDGVPTHYDGGHSPRVHVVLSVPIAGLAKSDWPQCNPRPCAAPG
ncbi:hypothetical protein AB3332_22990, partial [Ralstonia solanacearum]|uniref:hypothetical protein n=1 Tax=Ralstonia solanacearum TaxID=305 RepID=UPI0034DD0090